MDSISNKQIWWLLVVFTVIWFSNLEYRKLIKPDEGRYAEIPREMVVSGDWVTPRLNELKYFEKPPLQYWATAAAYTVFGEHQWTSRLWTGLTGFAGILLVWFAGMRLFGREAAGYAALLLSSSSLYVAMGHINTLDMGVTFFITLGILALLLAQTQTDNKKQRNWILLAWAGMALAVLSKGLMGLVLPGAALFIYMVVQRDFSVLKRMHWLPGLTVFFLVTAPWFYLVMKANPEFFERFFIYEHYTRFTTKEHGRYQPWYYFIPILLVGMLPWAGLMLDTLWKYAFGKKLERDTNLAGNTFNPDCPLAPNQSLPHARGNVRMGVEQWKGSVSTPSLALPPQGGGDISANGLSGFNAERFLLIWVVFVYVFFSMSGSKLPSYLLPMFPSLALLMGKHLVDMHPRRLFWAISPILPLALLALAFLPFTARFADTPLEIRVYGEYAYWLAAAFLLWLLGVISALILLRRPDVVKAPKLVAVLVLAFSFLIAAQLGTSGYNTIAKERSSYFIADAIRTYVKADVPFYSVSTYEQTLPFYLKHTFILVQYQDEMDFGIKQEPERWIPDIATFAKVWQAQPSALAITSVNFFPQLKQLNLDMKIIYEDTQLVVVSKP